MPYWRSAWENFGAGAIGRWWQPLLLDGTWAGCCQEWEDAAGQSSLLQTGTNLHILTFTATTFSSSHLSSPSPMQLQQEEKSRISPNCTYSSLGWRVATIVVQRFHPWWDAGRKDGYRAAFLHWRLPRSPEGHC